MIKISFTPEFLEWVTAKMRANDTGLDARQFAVEFFHRAFVGRGAEVLEAAPTLLAALTEPIQNTLTVGPDFAADIEHDATILEMHGYNVRADALRAKAQAIRAAIADAKGVAL